MKRVEAVVIRERVETVIDAFEDLAGHVGVTVVEPSDTAASGGSRTSTAARDLRRHLPPRQLAALAGLGALRDLDL